MSNLIDSEPSPSSLDNATATQLGNKTYLHGTTYNGGNAPTVTLLSGGGSLSAINRGVFIPYQEQDGGWRMKFHFSAACSNTTRTSVVFQINGILSKTIGNGGSQQAVTVTDITSRTPTSSYVPTGTSVVDCAHASASTSFYAIAGDIELDSKPTWAY